MAANKLTESQRRFLRDLVNDQGGMASKSITHSSMTALGKRDLAKWQIDRADPWGGRWVPTDAGRAALFAS